MNMWKDFVKRKVNQNRVLSNCYGWCRGSTQDIQAAVGLFKYELIAKKRKIVVPKQEQIGSILHERLKARRNDISAKPKQMGELRIFLLYHLNDWEHILPVSLQPFGEVVEFEYCSKGYKPFTADWLVRRKQLNRDVLEAFDRARAESPIDCVVAYISGYDIDKSTLEHMRRCGAVIFNFCWDDKLNFPGEKMEGRYSSTAEIASSVDLNLTNAPTSLVKYAVHGGLAMFWPEAAHPTFHCRLDVPFDVDVSFVGSRYGWRGDFIEKLIKKGIPVECHGKGWPNGPIASERIMGLYSRSRINLGFSSIGYSRRLMCLKGRDFEIPMTGNLYLTQHNAELELVFEIGKEILTYRSLEDCYRQIMFILEHPEVAAEIRRRARNRCVADHSYQQRWQQIFSISGLMAHKGL